MDNNKIPDWLLQAHTIAIVGYGREGKSTARFLGRHVPHATVIIMDDQQTFDVPEVDVVFKSPGIPLRALKLSGHPYLTSQADLFLQLFDAQSIGVTGTKGKSTTAHAIAHVLNEAEHPAVLLGNIGKPALDFVDRIDADTTVVFELSAFQCESLHTSPHIGVFTSLYQDHLDYYESMQEYERAKTHLFDLQSEDDICIFRDDYPEIVRLLSVCTARKIPYRESKTDEDVNYMPARIIACLFDISEKKIDHALALITPLSGRCENIGEYNGITFYDDALATIPEATIRALEHVKKVDTLIVGGFDRHQQFEQLARTIAHSSISVLIVFPETGPTIAKLVRQYNAKILVIPVDSMQGAIEAVYEHTPKGGTVLLSTASPSFGIFRDYADRSAQYISWVKKLSHL